MITLPSAIEDAIIDASADGTDFGFTVVYELELDAGTLYYSSREDITWGGNTYTPLATKQKNIKETMQHRRSEVSVTFSNVAFTLVPQLEPADLLSGKRMKIRLLILDDDDDPIADSLVLFYGIMTRPKKVTAKELQIRVVSLLDRKQSKLPGRLIAAWCGWPEFADGSICQYSYSDTASNTGSGDVLLSVNNTGWQEVNELLSIGGVNGTISTFSGTNITLSTGATWSMGDTISYQNCHRLHNKCLKRGQEHLFGGFVGERIFVEKLYTEPKPSENYPAGTLTYHSIYNVPFLTKSDMCVPVLLGRKVLDGLPIVDDIYLNQNAPQPIFGGSILSSRIAALSEGPIEGVHNGWQEEDLIRTNSTNSSDHVSVGYWWAAGTVGLTSTIATASYYSTTSHELSQGLPGLTGFGGRKIPYSFLGHVTYGVQPGSDGENELGEWKFEASGLLCQKYLASGATDGQPEFTTNPIWQMVEMLTNSRYGVGQYISTNDFDMTSVVAAAAVCSDTLTSELLTAVIGSGNTQSTYKTWITNGNKHFTGGMMVQVNGAGSPIEIHTVLDTQRLFFTSPQSLTTGDRLVGIIPRYECNYFMKEAKQVRSAIKPILQSCLAFVTQSGGKLQLQIEKAEGSTAATFSDFNAAAGYGIVKDSFTFEISDPEKDYNRILIEYTPQNEWVTDNIVDETDYASVAAKGVNPKTFKLDAVTGRDQARRIAKHKINKVEGTGAEFTVGPIGLKLQPGDVIRVTHTEASWTSLRKRVVSKEIIGLGSKDELCVKLVVEHYTSDAYPDAAPEDIVEDGPPTDEVTPVYTLSLVSGENRTVRLNWTVNGGEDLPAPLRATLHKSANPGFVPNANNFVMVATGTNLVYEPADSEIDSTIYFKLKAAYPNGRSFESNQLAVTPRNITDGTDPTNDQTNSPFNLVFDGDFAKYLQWSSGGGATVWTGPTNSTSTTSSGYQAVSNPGNAYDVTWSTYSTIAASYDGTNSTYSEEVWGGFVGGTGVTVYVKIDNVKSSEVGMGSIIQADYSTDSGSSWNSIGTFKGATRTNTWHSLLSGVIGNVTVADMQVKIKARPGVYHGASSIEGHVIDIGLGNPAAPPIGWTNLNYGIVQGTGVTGSSGELYRPFPGAEPSEVGTLFSADTVNTCTIWAKNNDAGQAADSPLEVLIRDSVTESEWVMLSVAASDITDSLYAYGSRWSPDTPIAGDNLLVVIRSKSSNAVAFDKLCVRRGSAIYAWSPSVEDLVNGETGDFTAGDALAFNAGAWAVSSTQYKMSEVT